VPGGRAAGPEGLRRAAAAPGRSGDRGGDGTGAERGGDPAGRRGRRRRRVTPPRARALLFQPFPIGHGGLVLPNRIWLPAMVTWRGTEDGFVTASVREIYL